MYKFLHKNLKSQNGNHTWEIGKWYTFPGKLEMCSRGFHCSVEPYDAFRYVQGEILAEVETRGNGIVQEDKQCWSGMRVVEAWHWTKPDSVKLAVFAAELVLPNFEQVYPSNNRPRKAIEAAKAWLNNPYDTTKLAE